MKRYILAALAALFFIVPGVSKADDIGARPGRWCGWYMQHDTGITSRGTGRNLNMAREWAGVGSNAGGPGVGVVVVWRHHVGRIVGQDARGQWLVHSGNDGNRVRTRVVSLRSAIAYRNVGGSNNFDLARQEDAGRGSNQHLVSLGVESGRRTVPLRKARPVAPVTRIAMATKTRFAPAPTNAAQFADEMRPQQSQPMVKRHRVAFGRGHTLWPVDVQVSVRRDAVHVELFAEVASFSRHVSQPYTGRASAVYHPNSQASLRLGARTQLAHLAPDSGARELGGGADEGWRASPSPPHGSWSSGRRPAYGHGSHRVAAASPF